LPTESEDPVDVWMFKTNEVNTQDRRFVRNKIRTNKYRWYNFVPKNLFEQFSKLANIYFLFIMILQIIPQISISGGKPAILMPLLFVVSVSAIKDFFEDRDRQKSDNMENNRKAIFADLTTGEYKDKIWKDLKVGMVVKILEN
jgi:phospholipid-transporting ATPase